MLDQWVYKYFMEPIKNFTELVWQGHFDGPLEPLLMHSEHLVDTSLQTNNDLQLNGGVSTSSDPNAPHLWPIMYPFLSEIWPQMEAVWDSWPLPKLGKGVMKSWVNRNPPGAYTDWHSHAGVDLVIVLYLKAPEQSGGLKISDPLAYHWNQYHREVTVPVTAGTVLMFPGWLHHASEVNRSNDSRITANFNLGRIQAV
jgi:hypothetical protein